MDIQLWEVGAKRRLNGTSKSEQTDRHTHTRTFRLIESIGPEGRCFENVELQIFMPQIMLVLGLGSGNIIKHQPWFFRAQGYILS